MSPLKLSTSYKHHVLVAIIIGVWLVLFLVLIAPFDTADLPMPIRVQILPPYGLISIVGYCMLVPAQNWLFRRSGKWNALFESVFLLVFNIIVWIGSYLYYKTDIINGVYSFSKFTLEVYYPIFFIILPILIFVRWYLNKKAPDPESDKIVLSGENKLDVLQIKQSDLICISSADNYVEVTYLTKDGVNRKLLRTTLKNVHAQKPELVKVHRSHVINPEHFKEWKDSNTILLTEIELPVSKSYKQNLVSLDHSPLKADSLSQT
ncbi:LytTR family DNA-binding domain-containing protein [Roseivirga sp. E12]|uniref:LytTR family DNA-binding domain-containing protein n=1 Tax=Roseivirga sp. E12 TaxID=2819237 RepID=UPI001ABC0F12|nr:LytTR family DNA-binding domain-containing protein [Roseivirga sp. E12]MBO3696880.1 LytTR family transcriptional regulator DNA-binding domain-containing protein [Roseivirga sp. E12]